MSSKKFSKTENKYIKDNMNTEDSLINKENQKQNEFIISRYKNNDGEYPDSVKKCLKIDIEKFLSNKSKEKITKDDIKEISEFISKRKKTADKNNEFNEDEDEDKEKIEQQNIENNLNIIKIYNRLKKLYDGNKNIVETKFFEILANINNNTYNDIEKKIKKFEELCKVIRGNLFVRIELNEEKEQKKEHEIKEKIEVNEKNEEKDKNENKHTKTFSNIFFQNIEPSMLKFFIIFYMIRTFFAIKNSKSKMDIYSIINKKNILAREIVSDVKRRFTDEYNFFEKKENSYSIKIDRSSKLFEKLEERKILKKEGKNLKNEYFGIYFGKLLDFIYFENTYLYYPPNTINISKNKNDGIFGKYKSYYGKLSVNNNDNYAYINEYKKDNEKNRYGDIYDKWNKYIKEEYENEGLKILYNSFEKYKHGKEEQKYDVEGKYNFYKATFSYLEKILKSDKFEYESKVKVINGIIKLILSDDENIFKFLDSEDPKNRDEFKKIIKSIIQHIILMIIIIINNKEIKSNIENKKPKNNDERDLKLLNSLIILLESFGEHKNVFFLEYIFDKNNKPKSVFDILIDQYEIILKSFSNINNKEIKEEIEYDNDNKNKLIILNSLTNCIIEYIELSNIISNNGKKEEDKNEKNKNEEDINKKDIKEEDKNEIDIKKENEDKGGKKNDIISTIINKIEIKNDKDIKNKKNIIYDMFILENHLLINIHLFKNLKEEEENDKLNYLKLKLEIGNDNNKIKQLFYKTLNIMNICFKGFLFLQKDLELSSIKKSERENKIIVEIKKFKEYEKNEFIKDSKNDSQYLFDIYKQGRLNRIIPLEKNGFDELVKYNIKEELLVLIYLNYQRLLYLIYSNKNLKRFKYFLHINDKDFYIMRAKYFFEPLFGYGNQRLIILLSFLQKIHDIIGIRINNEKFIQLNLLEPEYLNVSKNSRNYFYNLIDYSSPETKLMTIYNYIECIIYDIKRKQWEKDENVFVQCIRNLKFLNIFTTRTYKFWEVINLIAFAIINIILIIDYKKPRNEIESKFNEIENDKKFYITKIWAIVHIIILFFIIIYWFISRAKVDYFFSLTKYSNNYFEENEKLDMGQKTKLLKKDSDDFSINSFFPGKWKKSKSFLDEDFNIYKFIRKVFSSIYINYIKVGFYSVKTILPFIFSIIFLCLTFLSQIFFIIPLFLIFNLSETLLTIVFLFAEQLTTLFLIAIYFIIILYIFSWFGFFFLPKIFEYEAYDRNNEMISSDYEKERICSSTVPCILYFLNYGFRDSLMETNLFSFKDENGYYWRQYFFNLFIYIFIHLIFDNIFLVTIGNAFDDIKKNLAEKDEQRENVCFICNKTRNDCIAKNQNFDEHIKKHDLWKYIRYICTIILKKRNQYTNEEYYVWKQIKKKEIKWFPNFKENKEEEEK